MFAVRQVLRGAGAGIYMGDRARDTSDGKPSWHFNKRGEAKFFETGWFADVDIRKPAYEGLRILKTDRAWQRLRDLRGAADTMP